MKRNEPRRCGDRHPLERGFGKPLRGELLFCHLGADENGKFGTGFLQLHAKNIAGRECSGAAQHAAAGAREAAMGAARAGGDGRIRCLHICGEADGQGSARSGAITGERFGQPHGANSVCGGGITAASGRRYWVGAPGMVLERAQRDHDRSGREAGGPRHRIESGGYGVGAAGVFVGGWRTFVLVRRSDAALAAGGSGSGDDYDVAGLANGSEWRQAGRVSRGQVSGMPLRDRNLRGELSCGCGVDAGRGRREILRDDPVCCGKDYA